MWGRVAGFLGHYNGHMPLYELKKAYPEEPMPFAACGMERHKDDRGFNYVVRFPDKLVGQSGGTFVPTSSPVEV